MDRLTGIDTVNKLLDLSKMKVNWYKLYRCPACGYYDFNGIECYACGYTVRR